MLSKMSYRVARRWLRASAPSLEVIKWLVARTKKAKGIVNISLAEEAFQLLPGWSISDTTSFLPLNSPSGSALVKGLVKSWGIEPPDGGYSSKDSFYFQNVSGEEPSLRIQQEFKQHAQTVTTKGKTPDGVAKVGVLYATPVTKVDQWGSSHPGVLKMWLGVPGWIISAPNGVVGVLPSPVGRRGKPEDPSRLEKWDTFWTFLNKAGIEAASKKALESHTQAVQDLSVPATERKRIEQKRTLLPEVEEMLRSIVDQQFQRVWDRLTDLHLSVLKGFLDKQEKVWEEVKDEPYPKWDPYHSFLKDVGAFSTFINQATELDLRGQKYDLGFGWVKRKGNYVDLAKAEGKRIAEDLREEFVIKNGFKLSTIVRTKGNLSKGFLSKVFPGEDFGGELIFEFSDGSKFVVRNKSVFKISHLGAHFVQFPTTFHDVSLPGGVKMAQPSEQRMLDVFAVA